MNEKNQTKWRSFGWGHLIWSQEVIVNQISDKSATDHLPISANMPTSRCELIFGLGQTMDSCMDSIQ
jgi:hypothetical protein